MATDHNFKVKNGLHVLGSEGVYLTDTNTRLHEGNGNALRIQTGTGYVDLGSMNSSWVHFQANKNIYILPSTHVSIDGHLYPYTDSARTLGGNTVRWSHTYTDNITVTDNVTIGGTISSGDINTTGNITITSTYPKLSFVDTDNNPDISIIGGSGQIAFYDETNSGYVYQYISNQHNFAAKNLTNIGTISSGAITSTGASSFGNVTSLLDLNLPRNDGTSPAVVIAYFDRFRFITDSTGNYNEAQLGVNPSNVLFTNNGYAINTTTVIDASRNLTNIGTINTGQGATEVYLMNQNVRSSDSPTFQDLTIQGNLAITGDINSYNVTDLDVVDKTITLGVGGTASANDGGGIIVDGANAKLTWNNTNSYWQMNKKLAFNDTATTSNQGLGLVWSGFDKEGTTDFTDNASIVHTTNTGGHAGSVLLFTAQNDANDGIAFVTNASSSLKHNSSNILTAANFTSNITPVDSTKLPLAGGTMTGTLAMGANAITSTGTISSGAITSTGNSSLGSVSVAGNLVVDDTLTIGDNTANSNSFIKFKERIAATETNNPFIGQTNSGNGVSQDLGLGANSSSGTVKIYAGNVTAFSESAVRLKVASDHINFTEPLQMGGTEFLSDSRNLTNIGTISSGAINTTEKLTITNANFNNHIEFVRGSATMGLSPSGNELLVVGGGLAPSDSVSRSLGRSDKIWANVYANTYRIGATTVINSSRNLLNIGTISSGAITSTATESTLRNSSGVTLKLTTNGSPGSVASKLPLHIDFNGYGQSTMARIRSWDESSSTADGFLEFYTNNFTGSHALRRVLLLDNDRNATFDGNIAVSGTVDGVDIAARNAVLTTTTNTANAALPKAGGTMTGTLTMGGNAIINANLTGASTYLPGHAFSNTHDGTHVYWHIGSASGSTNKVLNLRIYNSSNNYVVNQWSTTGLSVAGTLTATTVNTGQGANELYAMNQNVRTTDSPTFNQVTTTNNGSGTNYKVGDDAWIGDINVANTIRISGAQNANNGYISFGNSSNTALGRAGTGQLTWGSDEIYHEGHKPTYSELGTMAYSNLTGTPTIPSLSGYATQSYVGTQISNLVDSSPSALNTLNELAAALGDDASFSTTVTNSIATKMPKAGGTFTGGTTYNVNGDAITISSAAPQMRFNDTTSGDDDFWIHVNSNNFYVLVDRDGNGSWDGDHPLQLEGDTNIGYVFGQRIFNEAYHPNADTLTTARTIAGTSFNGSANIDISYNNLTNKPTIPTNNNQLTNGAGYITSSGTANQSNMVTGSAFATTSSPGSVLEYQQASGQTDTKLAPDGNWHNTIRMGHGNPYSYYSNTLAMQMTGTGVGRIRTQTISNNTALGWREVWDSGNDGSGSGLDADTLDGQHASAFLTGNQTITLSGDVSGSGTTSIAVTVADDSHNHVISNVDGLQTALDAKEPSNATILHRGSDISSADWNTFIDGTEASWNTVLNHSGSNRPVGYYTYGTALSFSKSGQAKFQLYASEQASSGNGGLAYRTGWDTTYRAWANLWDSANDGSGSGLDADLLDGIDSGSFLRSDADDTLTGNLQINSHVINMDLGNINDNAIDLVSVRSSTWPFEFTTHSVGNDNSSGFWVGSNGYPDMRLRRENSTVRALISSWETSYVSNGFNINGNTAWHAGNDGSGSGLDADLLDSYQLNTGRANVANRVVATDSNGYIQAGWINTTSGATSSTLTRIYCSQDGYIRYQTPANFGVSISPHINYNTIANKPTIPTNNNQLTNGAGYTTNLGFSRYNASTTYAFGNLQRFTSNTNLATASGTQSSLEVFSSGSGNDAFMTFHVGSDYAIYLGLDGGTNKLSVGGWSMGANSYEIYHSGNKPSLATLGYTGATNANYITNNNQLTNGAGYITGVTNVSGYAGDLIRQDNRTISPNELTAGRLKFGFTSWGNNNGSPYADFLHLRSYTDASGGADNLVMFKKSGIGMRIWQQTWGSSTAYSNYADVWHTSNDGSGSGLDADLLDGLQTASGPTANTIPTRTANGDIAAREIILSSALITATPTVLVSMYPGTNQLVRTTPAAVALGMNAWTSSNDGSGSGLDADSLDGYHPQEGAVNNSIVKRDGTASIKAHGISLMRQSTATTGISWYNEAYYNWQDYMAAPGATSCGPNGNLTAPTGLAGVTSWALRSRMEGVASYGWNWETGGGGGGGATATSKMSLQAVSGNLQIAGSFTAGGNVTAYSDKKLKDDVKVIENAVEKIKQVRGVTFIRNDIEDNKRQAGVIAQEVEKVLPEVVGYDEDRDTKTVAYGNMVGLLIEAIKEQQETIDKLTSRLDDIEKGE